MHQKVGNCFFQFGFSKFNVNIFILLQGSCHYIVYKVEVEMLLLWFSLWISNEDGKPMNVWVTGESVL